MGSQDLTKTRFGPQVVHFQYIWSLGMCIFVELLFSSPGVQHRQFIDLRWLPPQVKTSQSRIYLKLKLLSSRKVSQNLVLDFFLNICFSTYFSICFSKITLTFTSRKWLNICFSKMGEGAKYIMSHRSRNVDLEQNKKCTYHYTKQ